MAKYLRPRRGSKDSAFAQKILLKKGEVFLEFPNSEIGRGPGRLVVGDGATSYQNMNYTSTATNVFRPFITDPELYVPRFENSTYATSGWTVDAGTEAINAMGDGSSASTVALPTFLGLVKNALCKHTNSIVKINNDLTDKADKTIFSISAEGLVPKPTNATTVNFLKGDGTWAIPNNTTYDVASTAVNGLVPKLPTSNPAEKYLDGNGSFSFIPNATTESKGLMTAAYARKVENFIDETNKWVDFSGSKFLQNATSTDNYSKIDGAQFNINTAGTYLMVMFVQVLHASDPEDPDTQLYPDSVGVHGTVNTFVGTGNTPQDTGSTILSNFPISQKEAYYTFSVAKLAALQAGTNYVQLKLEYSGTGLPTNVTVSGWAINLRNKNPFTN